MIEATDTLTVLGTHKLLAGAIQQVTTGDYAVGTQTNFVVNVGDSMLIEAVNKIEEKAGQIKSSIAGVKQEIIAPVVWVGSESINIMQLMLDTLGVVKELAQLTASHTHKDTGAPLNKEAISGAASNTDTLKNKYKQIVG